MQTKILIIGAGPAGLSAAIELKKKGDFDVTILEQKPHADYKVCAGGIEHSFIKEHLSCDIIERNFSAIRFTTPEESIYIKNGDIMLSTVNRRILHEYLAKNAVGAGVKIIFNQSLKDVGANFVTTNSGDTYEFDRLIGADGSNSVVRKKLKLQSKKNNSCIPIHNKRELS